MIARGAADCAEGDGRSCESRAGRDVRVGGAGGRRAGAEGVSDGGEVGADKGAPV